MRVTISLEAEAAVADIADHIALDNPVAADRLNARLYEACFALAEEGELFQVAEGLETLGVRRRSVGQYLILYVIRPGEVLVLRIVHGMRDYPKLFID